MRSRDSVLKIIEEEKIIAVVRLAEPAKAVPMAEALVHGGVTCIEITLTSARALEIIKELKTRLGHEALIGVGSVINSQQVVDAVEAGADFIVSPVMRPAIIDMAHSYDKVAIIGAFTPTEILEAWEKGADIVKVFPATKLGPSYFKDLSGPLPQIRLTPTGGVDLDTARAFLDAGAVCLGVGSSLVRKDFISGERWHELRDLAEKFVQVVK